MPDKETFAVFMQRIRSGDAEAAKRLVQQYEPLIRREVRLRLEDPRLGRLFDSMDVCQSVLASFFVRAATGQYDLGDPQQLVRLLVRMVRNKVASAARRQSRQRRDHRRQTYPEQLNAVADRTVTPSHVVASRELLHQVREQLTAEENQIVDLRAAGLSWEEVAAQLGGSAQARRMQMARAVARAATAVGFPEDRL